MCNIVASRTDLRIHVVDDKTHFLPLVSPDRLVAFGNE